MNSRIVLRKIKFKESSHYGATDTTDVPTRELMNIYMMLVKIPPIPYIQGRYIYIELRALLLLNWDKRIQLTACSNRHTNSPRSVRNIKQLLPPAPVGVGIFSIFAEMDLHWELATLSITSNLMDLRALLLNNAHEYALNRGSPALLGTVIRTRNPTLHSWLTRERGYCKHYSSTTCNRKNISVMIYCWEIYPELHHG